MLKKYKFIDREITRTHLVVGDEKVDVRKNEIVESELEPKYFTKNGFIEVKVMDEPKKIKFKKK